MVRIKLNHKKNFYTLYRTVLILHINIVSFFRNGHKILNQLGNLREWANRAQLDPNDPSNADLFEFIEVYKMLNGN